MAGTNKVGEEAQQQQQNNTQREMGQNYLKEKET